MRFRKKKNVRFRGQKTQGYGSMKKHRGAGHRGGRGRSGSGKRADQKKPSYWKTEKAGKHGFKSRSRAEFRPITLRDLGQKINKFVMAGKAKKAGDTYIINLADLNFNRLIAKGTTRKKCEITVDHVTASAKKKVEAAGGTVTSPSSEEHSSEGDN